MGTSNRRGVYDIGPTAALKGIAMKTLKITSAVLAIVAMFPLAATAVVVSLNAVQDTTLCEHAAGALSNGSGEYLFAGRTATGSIRRGLVAFDISDNMPPGSVINNAVLQLYMSRTLAGPKILELRRIVASWGEGA